MVTKFIALPDDYKVNGYGAQLKVKSVKCGKPGCTKCPHGSYAYLVYRVGNQSGRATTKEFYIGQIKPKVKKEPIASAKHAAPPGDALHPIKSQQ